MKKFTLILALTAILHATSQNHINGYATECMMDSFFMYGQKWQKIDGENGSHGIDGLYIKYHDNHISDILVAESKYNHSQLGWTKKHTIKQMSKAWIIQKLKEAKPNNSKVKHYDEIITLVKKGVYRARLFRLKPLLKDRFKIILYNIKSKSTRVTKRKISQKLINITHPKNNFEKAMAKNFLRCKSEQSCKK